MKSVWKNRDFVWLVAGQTLSEFGSSTTGFAIPWLILELTGSAAQMGFAFAVGFLPYLLLSLPAGVWADRHNRKTLMLTADAIRMLLIVSIPVAHGFGVLTIWQLYAVSAGMSACAALFDTSYVACLPNVVSKEQLSSANAVLQTGISASQVLGPPLAGVMIGFMGAANTVVVNGATYLISVLSLFVIRASFSAQRASTSAKSSMLKDIGEGLQFVWRHKLIRTISFFTMTGNLFNAAVSALLLYHLEHNLHVSASFAGLMMTGFSIGTILGSFISPLIAKWLPMGKIMSIGQAGMSLAALIMGIVPSALVIGLTAVLQGISGVVWNIQSITLRQSVIPDELLGRAGSAIRMIAWGSMPLGSAAGGTFGQFLGAPAVFLASGVMEVGLWLWGWTTPLYRVKRGDTFESPNPPDAPEAAPSL